jgi:TRAP-type transport system periplasmic protein
MSKENFVKKNLIILVVLSILLSGNIFAGGQQESGEESMVKATKVFIAGTSGKEDTQSMGHFDYAERLNATGAFAAEVKINAVMGETDDVTEQAIQGVPVINATDPGRLAAYVPEFGLVQMPYLLPDYTYLNKIRDTKLYAKWDKEFQEKGLKLVTVNGYSGVRSWVTDFPVNTPADLKGVKIRTIGSDLFVNSVNAMGAIATALPWAETYQGMEQGVVDGCEAQIPGIYSMRFYEIKSYVSLSEHFTLIASMVTGTKFFDGLSAENQTILLDTAFDAYKDNQAVVVSKSLDYIKEMEAAGVTFVEIDKTPFVNAVQSVYVDMGFSELKKDLYAELGL